MKATKVLTLVLLVSLLANAHGVCLLGLVQLNLLCNAIIPLCDLDNLLSILCGGDTLVQINVASGNHLLQISSPTSLVGLDITTTGSATLTVSLAAAVTVLDDIVLTGAGVILQIAQGVTVNVTGNTIVGAGAALQVAGNLGVKGYTQISGNLNMQGTLAPGSRQTAWVYSPNPVNVTGTPSSPATVNGNGGIDSSVAVYGNTRTGTSGSDSSLYISQDLQVSSGTMLKLGGNVTVNGYTSVFGRLHLDGALVFTTPKSTLYSNLNSPNQIYLVGTAYETANLTGNGVINANVTLGDYTVLSAGNSPGVIRVNGGLVMSPTSYMEIEVASSSSFDEYIVKDTLTRNGQVNIDFDSPYLPNGNDRFAFCTHANSTGSFITTTSSVGGNYVYSGYFIKTTMFVYMDAQAAAYCTCTSV